MSTFPRPNRNTSEMVWVRAPISGAKWQVHREVAPLLAHIVSTAERRGYLFDHGPGDVDDDWGYNVRRIAGSSNWSWHSAGVAVDIDAQQYPQGQRRKVPPGWLIDLFRQWGWEWGGTWSHADPMHFEATDRDRVARLRATLYASGLSGGAIPVPVGTPPIVPPVSVPSDVPEEDPMQIVHCPDAPATAHVDPNPWGATDGTTARPLAPGEPDHIVMMGLVPRPVRDAAGGLRPYPLPWTFFQRLRR